LNKQSKQRFTSDGNSKILRFQWSQGSLNNLVDEHAPCSIIYQAEEFYSKIIFDYDLDGKISNRVDYSAEEVFGKMKSLLFRSNRAEIIFKKKVNKMGKIRTLNSGIITVGKINVTEVTAYQLRILSEDYNKSPYDIYLRCDYIPVTKKRLYQIKKEINNYPFNSDY